MAAGRSVGDTGGGGLNVPGNVKSKCSETRVQKCRASASTLSLPIHLDYQFKLCCSSSVIMTSEFL